MISSILQRDFNRLAKINLLFEQLIELKMAITFAILNTVNGYSHYVLKMEDNHVFCISLR